MTIARRTLAHLCLFALLLASAALLAQAAAKPDQSLVGIWGTEQFFGPLVRGALTIDGRQSQWRARFAGFNVLVDRNGNRITFFLPGGAGEFRGRLTRALNTISGDWIQPGGVINNNRYATPVHLALVSASIWRGTVSPLDDRVSFYVSIKRKSADSLTAFIINPESNLFRRRSYDVALDGSTVTFTNVKRPDDHFAGTYDKASDRLSLPLLDSYPPLPLSHRNLDDALALYPRTPATSEYAYAKPITGTDGWPTASLAEVGIAEQPIAALVKMILTADPSDNPVDIDSLLIARHGKLVLEEYFHGFDEERPHDMRSASKTFAPLLVGIARDHDIKVVPDTLVYPLFPEDEPFAHWDARKSQVTLKALMTMTSGFACDDNDDASPGNEDKMESQTAQPNCPAKLVQVHLGPSHGC